MPPDVAPALTHPHPRFVPTAYGEVTGAAPALLAQLLAPQRLGLLLAAAAAIAIGIGTWLWARTPDYKLLYAQVSDRDGGAIVAALQQMNVPYKIAGGGGAILVPDDQVYEVRLKLAGQGLPKGGLVGFEVMENTRLGASQFLEQVNYQRALEGELARSIQAVSAVQSARVHLAISKPSVFVRDPQKPSASVMVNLHPGRTLDAAQVSAIVHLISSSVPELPVKNVTVVDQNGALLSSEGQAASGLDATQLKYVRDLEAKHMKRIEAILTPLVGAENVRAQVTADVDFAQTERAEETFRPNRNPDEAAMRSQQTSERPTGGAGTPATGVPGALSNQPPSPASAPIDNAPQAQPSASGAPGADKAAAGTAAQPPAAPAHKDATINYEVDRTIRHIRQSMGSVRRLSAAVVVNHRREIAGDGKVSFKPLTAEEMAQITDLVKEAMGYTAQRGDTINVANAAFTTPDKEVVTETPLWKQPETISTLKEVGRYAVAIGVLIYLVFGVLKPLLRRAAAAAAAAPALPPPALVGRHATSAQEGNLDRARQLARDEPKLVANVVKQWVGGNE